jgi:hypothetical protein
MDWTANTIDKKMRYEVAEFLISGAAAQQLTIIAEGEDVELFERNVPPAMAGSDEVMPDIIELFVKLAELGMFCGRRYTPASSGATLLKTEFDRERKRQTWLIETRHVDPGAFKVLANLLLARRLDRISIRTTSVSEPAAGQETLFPAPPEEYPGEPVLPFALEHPSPHRAYRDRSIRIVFEREPQDSTLEQIYAVMDDWIRLLLLGSYPPESHAPSESGVIPDLAYLADPVTVDQSFAEAFICDEAAFVPIISWAVRLHSNVERIRKIVIH